jgi:hypothetical protein
MVKAITGTYHHGRVELNELPTELSEPTSIVTIFLESGESIPPELTQILTPTTTNSTIENIKSPPEDLQTRLAKLQNFIASRAQQQPSPEAAAFFERFKDFFDAEREPEQKLFQQDDEV